MGLKADFFISVHLQIAMVLIVIDYCDYRWKYSRPIYPRSITLRSRIWLFITIFIIQNIMKLIGVPRSRLSSISRVRKGLQSTSLPLEDPTHLWITRAAHWFQQELCNASRGFPGSKVCWSVLRVTDQYQIVRGPPFSTPADQGPLHSGSIIVCFALYTYFAIYCTTASKCIGCGCKGSRNTHHLK